MANDPEATELARRVKYLLGATRHRSLPEGSEYWNKGPPSGPPWTPNASSINLRPHGIGETIHQQSRYQNPIDLNKALPPDPPKPSPPGSKDSERPQSHPQLHRAGSKDWNEKGALVTDLLPRELSSQLSDPAEAPTSGLRRDIQGHVSRHL